MGMSADTLHIPLGNWEELSRDFALSDLVKAGLDNRIDLLVAQKSTEVTTREYKLTRAERRPDIGVSVSYERNWNGFLSSVPFCYCRCICSSDILEYK